MSFKKIQKDVDDWTSQFKPQYWPPADIMLRVTEEVGELARETNHRFGSKPKKPSEETGDLGEEIAGIIFALACYANTQKIDLDKAWQKEIDKYKTRDKDRFTKR